MEAAAGRRSYFWLGPALLGAMLINVGLFSLVTLLSQERRPAQDISDPAGISLVSLEPPEPPKQEEVKKPKPPEPKQKMDFQPDLAPPPLDLGGPSFDAGLSINLGGMQQTEFEEQVVFNSYELDTQPQTLMRMQPQYPYKAREQGIEGVVQVKLLVSVDGSVGEVHILAARPEGIFEDAVRNAVPKWKFDPGKIAGEPVTAWVITNVRFDLN